MNVNRTDNVRNKLTRTFNKPANYAFTINELTIGTIMEI